MAGVAIQICPDDADLRGLATAGALRCDVVENPVVSAIELVDGRRGKDVRLRKGDIARMVDDALIAGEGALLGKTWRPAGNIRVRLIITKTPKHGVVVREIVV